MSQAQDNRYWVMDPDGSTRSMSMDQWLQYQGEPGRDFGKDKRVALDEVGKYRVSTVFLGIDHQWGAGPPLLFETMVFEGDDYSDLYCARYTTRAQALAGHDQVVAAINAGTAPEDIAS